MARIAKCRSITAALATAFLTCAMATCTATSALADSGSQPAASQAAGPAVEICGAGPALVRPGSVILTCADHGAIAEHLRWSSWTGTQAIATGIVTWRACSAACAYSRRWDSTTARFTLIDPASGPRGRILFTNLRMHVSGPTPPGFMRNLTFDEAPMPAVPGPAQTRVPAPGQARARPSQSSSAPSGSLSYAKIEGFWVHAGGPSGSDGSYTYAQVAAAITYCESSYEPGVIQPDEPYSATGWGLWQITPGNSVPEYGTDFQVLDPWNNAEEAVYKYDAAGGFSPWTTYLNGCYAHHLQDTAPDTSVTDPGEYVQINSAPSGTPSSPAADPGSKFGPAMPFICNQYLSGLCLKTAGSGNVVEVTDVGDLTNFTGINPITWEGHTDDVYQYQQDGTDLCLEFDAGEIDGNYDIVRMATCDSSIVSQYWWYSGDHNLVNDYATSYFGQQACMDVLQYSSYYADVDDCTLPYATGSNVWS
jgi:hypothetical protein